MRCAWHNEHVVACYAIQEVSPSWDQVRCVGTFPYQDPCHQSTCGKPIAGEPAGDNWGHKGQAAAASYYSDYFDR